MKCSKRILVFSVLAALASTHGARAQVIEPSAANDLSVGPGTGQLSPVSPTGGYSATLPIGLPSPRGGRLSLPFGVTYTGGTQVGAAGSGWDIPLSFVRRSTDTWHRKPAAGADANGNIYVPERITVSLGGSSMLMVPGTDPDVYVPFVADEYTELRRVGQGWILETASGVQYVFQPTTYFGDHSLQINDFWLLSRVNDTVGGDHIELRYDTAERGCGDLIYPGHNYSGRQPGPELDVSGFSFGYDAADLPLYDVELGYTQFPLSTRPSDMETACGPVAEGPWFRRLGATDLGGQKIFRSQVLSSIAIYARNNLDPAASAHRIDTFQVAYADDPDTGLPRLQSVEIEGEEGSSTSAMPLVGYQYGAISAADGTVRFGDLRQLPLGADAIAAGVTGLAGSTDDPPEFYNNGPGDPVDGEVRMDRVRSRYLIRDFTGDGIPDLVFKEGDHWRLDQGLLTEDGPSLLGPSMTWSFPAGPAELFVQETRQHTAIDHTSPRWRTVVTTETLTEFVDWNGDGCGSIASARSRVILAA